MQLLKTLVDLVLHLDKHLTELTAQYGTLTYGILTLIVFCETGLVVLPILPGDSLLFAAGAITSLGELNVFVLGLLLIAAAIVGDTVNYHIGKAIGPRVLTSETSRFLNKKHLVRTQKFFEKHGGKTIILARFMPIIRTFAPFVAGAGTMNYGRFIAYNVVGAVAWVTGFLGLGFVFGQNPTVKKNFTLVIIGIIIVSVMPAVIEWVRNRNAPDEDAPKA